MLRKFLVKNLVGYWHTPSNIAKEIAKLILWAMLGTFVLTRLDNLVALVIMALLAGVLFILPIKTKPGSYLRAAKILWPGYALSFIVMAATLPFTWEWYQILLVLWMLLLAWLGFSGWGGGYFDIWKVRLSDLDEEQLTDYNNDRLHLNLHAED